MFLSCITATRARLSLLSPCAISNAPRTRQLSLPQAEVKQNDPETDTHTRLSAGMRVRNVRWSRVLPEEHIGKENRKSSRTSPLLLCHCRVMLLTHRLHIALPQRMENKPERGTGADTCSQSLSGNVSPVLVVFWQLCNNKRRRCYQVALTSSRHVGPCSCQTLCCVQGPSEVLDLWSIGRLSPTRLF